MEQSHLIDCRLSAYPYPVPEINGTNAQIPNFFLSDLDKNRFKTNKALEQCLQQSLQNYEIKLHGAKPTVLWTGGGYHILQSLDADIVLERQNIFKEFIPFNPSRELMRYAEMLMTDGKADPVHNSTVAFGNCILHYTSYSICINSIYLVYSRDRCRAEVETYDELVSCRSGQLI